MCIDQDLLIKSFLAHWIPHILESNRLQYPQMQLAQAIKVVWETAKIQQASLPKLWIQEHMNSIKKCR